jgi:nitrite reductase (NO-forming)
MFRLARVVRGVALGLSLVPVMAFASGEAMVAMTSATHSGEKLYKSACFVCHSTGAANAPKLGDKAAWAPRIAEGMDAVMEIAIKGKGAMPPRGGANKADDATLRAAVEYIIKSAQ